MTNLVDVEICTSNISRVVNAMNHGEGCEEVCPNKLLILFDTGEITLARSLFWSSNIFKKKAESDSEFFFASEVNNADTLRSVFWADGRAISSYLSF